MLRTIIIDDEQDGRDVLQLLITDFCPELEIIDICSNGTEGVRSILKHKPDLVFMDIDMPDMTGFDVLDCVKNLKLKIIFVTAHNEHAIRAFKYSAIDYILKPPSPLTLRDAVEKAQQIEFRQESSQYDLLLNQLKSEDHLPDVLALPMADGLQVVKIQDILYCKADRNYTHIHFIDTRKVLVSKQLKEFEALLTPHAFFRVHHSSLINLKYISKYVKGEGGYIIMQDNSTIELSRQKKDEFLKLINKV